MMKTKLRLIVLGHLLSAVGLPAFAQGTAFTYQGRLNDGANPASGSYDLVFTLYPVSSGGIAAAGPLTNSATGVTNGLFTVPLDFGASAFTGSPRWLEIGVRTNGGGAFSTLTPRQETTPAPYAIYAESASASQLTGTIRPSNLSGNYNNAVTFTNAGNNFAGNGGGLTNLNAASLGGVAASNLWQLGGNNVAPGQFLGSTNTQTLQFRANNQRVMQFTYASNAVSGYSPNLIGGHTANFARGGVVGATIAGGGNTGVFGTNAVLSDFGAVLGGQGNTAGGKYSTVGGLLSAANGQYSTAFGGVSTADADFATAMGQSTASGTNSTAMGQSTATKNNATAMGNSSATSLAATAMGSSTASGWASTALGSSSAAGVSATAAGSSTADPGADFSAALGNSETADPYCTAMGRSHAGRNGLGGGAYATAMGSNSWATGFAATAMGNDTDASGDGSTAMGIGGTASGQGSISMSCGSLFFIPPVYTTASGYHALAMGSSSTASGDYSIAMGSYCLASGKYSFAAGQYAQALNPGAFVWADTSPYPFYSDQVDQARFRSTGGFIIVTGVNGAGIATAGASLAPNATSWSVVSDRNAKKNLQPLDTVDVLNKLAGIPITHWNYTWEADTNTPHIGPMAQDFKAAFYPNRDDKTITTLEFDGVALAAIQGLNQKLNQKETEIAELKQRLERLERLLPEGLPVR